MVCHAAAEPLKLNSYRRARAAVDCRIMIFARFGPHTTWCIMTQTPALPPAPGPRVGNKLLLRSLPCNSGKDKGSFQISSRQRTDEPSCQLWRTPDIAS